MGFFPCFMAGKNVAISPRCSFCNKWQPIFLGLLWKDVPSYFVQPNLCESRYCPSK